MSNVSKSLEMRQKRAEIWDRAKNFLNEHTDENGMMSAEDTEQYERMEKEVVDMAAVIDRLERAEQMAEEMRQAQAAEEAEAANETEEAAQEAAPEEE